MRNKTILIFVCVILVPFFYNCNIEKRHYNKGYYLTWKNNNYHIINDNPIIDTSVKHIGKKSSKFPVLKSADKVTIIPEKILCLSNKNGNTISLESPHYNYCMNKKLNYVSDVSEKKIKETNILPGNHHKSNKIDKQPDNRITHWTAIAGLILGILGIYPLIIIGSILAIIFSIIALSKIKKEPEKYKGKGMAIAALTLGIIGLVLGILFIIFFYFLTFLYSNI